MPQVPEVRRVVRRHFEALGLRVHAVGEQVDAGIGDAGIQLAAVQVVGDGVEHRLGHDGPAQPDQVAAADDALLDLDVIGIEGDLQAVEQVRHEAAAEVGRLFRLQRVEARHLGGRGVGRQLHEGEVRGHVGARIELLGQGRGPQTGGHRAAQGEGRVEVVAARQLAHRGIGEVAVVLEAHGGVEVQFLHRVGGQVGIDAQIVPGVIAGIAGLVARERLGPCTIIGVRFTRGDAEFLVAGLDAQGHVQRRGQTHVEGPVDVQGVGPLAGGEGAVTEVALGGQRRGRGGLQHREQVGIGRVQGLDPVMVAAIGGGEVPVPAADDALQAGGEGVVILEDAFPRAEAQGQRIDGGAAAGHAADLHRVAVVLEGRGGPVAHVAEGIAGQGRAEVIARVEEQVVDPVARVAVDVVDVGRARGLLHAGSHQRALDRAEFRARVVQVGPQGAVRVEEAGVGPALAAEAVELAVEGHVDEALAAQVEALVQAGRGGLAVALEILAARGREAAAGRALLQDDVDHAGDGVRAVLGGGAVLQHFDVVDGPDGDEAEVRGRRALIGAARVDGEVGRGVATLAVDQDQRVIGVQAAQRRRQGQRRGVRAVALGVERGQGLGQGLHQVRLADPLQGFGADHLDRRGAVGGLHAGHAGAGDDDGGHIRRRGRGICRLHARRHHRRCQGNRGDPCKFLHRVNPLGCHFSSES